MTVVLVLGIFGVACSQSPTDPVEGDLAVLFIGNSLTYWNEMPEILEALLKESDAGATFIESIAEPNYGLEDHWHSQAAKDRIASQAWDVVIMQQGPSATEGRPSLLEYSQRFAEIIRSAGAVPGLYMVWPEEARRFDFPGVRDSYRAAADSVDGYFFPAGAAWQEAWQLDESLELYGPDRFHPSALGSYLAAVVIWEQLTGQKASDLNRHIGSKYGSVKLDDQLTGLTLHDAASAANRKFAR